MLFIWESETMCLFTLSFYSLAEQSTRNDRVGFMLRNKTYCHICVSLWRNVCVGMGIAIYLV